MTKRIFAICSAMSIILTLAGCSKNTQNNISEQTGTVEVLSGSTGTTTSVDIPAERNTETQDTKGLTPDIIDALNALYNTKLSFTNVERSGNFVVATATDGSNGPDSEIQIVAAKINGKRLKLYEGNSGEVSCSLHEKFGFPTELLEGCTSGADYTIPKESLPFAK